MLRTSDNLMITVTQTVRWQGYDFDVSFYKQDEIKGEDMKVLTEDVFSG